VHPYDYIFTSNESSKIHVLREGDLSMEGKKVAPSAAESVRAITRKKSINAGIDAIFIVT
jgi:hypothetical protein